MTTFFFLLLLMRGKRIQIALKAGHHRPASETHLMAFRWGADDGPTLNDGFGSFEIFQGVPTSIAKKPYIFVKFQGVGGGVGVRPPCPPLDPHMRAQLDPWLPFKINNLRSHPSYINLYGKICLGSRQWVKACPAESGYILVRKQYRSRSAGGAQWLSGRVLDSRLRGRGFKPHRRHCVVSLSKNINPSLVLVQPRKTLPL